VYAKIAAAALGFISSTIHLSPRCRIGMTDSEEPARGSGHHGGGTLQGHGRGRDPGPDH
jgi:hypothetical protein